MDYTSDDIPEWALHMNQNLTQRDTNLDGINEMCSNQTKMQDKLDKTQTHLHDMEKHIKTFINIKSKNNKDKQINELTKEISTLYTKFNSHLETEIDMSNKMKDMKEHMGELEFKNKQNDIIIDTLKKHILKMQDRIIYLENETVRYHDDNLVLKLENHFLNKKINKLKTE